MKKGDKERPKAGDFMSVVTAYTNWLSERGLVVPLYNPVVQGAAHPFADLRAQDIEVQYAGALEPKCLFILDAYDMEQWQVAFAFMLRISRALGLSPSDVGVLGVLTQLPAWPETVNEPLKSIVEQLTSKNVSQILSVGKRAHDLFKLNIDFERATLAPDSISISGREFRYLAIWDHRDMTNQPALKKTAWLAMQQLLNH